MGNPDIVTEEGTAASRRTFLKLVIAGAAGFATVSCAAPALSPGKSGRLRVAWGGAPVTLDPLSASSDTEIAFLNAVYDYLIDTGPQSELVPRLAREWTVSEEARVYTLNLAEDVHFHDGSLLTAADVVWTFNRLRDPASQSATSDLYSDIETVEAGSDTTVVFRLKERNPDFLLNLSDSHAVILKAGAEGIGAQFNGTGPFRLVEYLAEDRAVFAANTNYWAGKPRSDSLEFIYFADTTAAVNALREGVVDAVLRMDNPTFRELAGDSTLQALQVATNGHDLVRLRADRAPGNDERVRRAFKLATDRHAIFDRVQLGYGAIGHDTPIGPLYAAYYTDEYLPPARDPQAARSLLADAGYPDGLAMTLYVPNLPDRVALAQALAAQWEEAGILISIEPQEEGVYYADNGWLEVDLGITPWASRPTPQFYLDVAYRSGAVWNEAHFSDPELDALIDQAGSALQEADRVEAYRNIQRILVERGPVIIPYFFAQFGVLAQNVEGITVHPFAGRTDFRGASA